MEMSRGAAGFRERKAESRIMFPSVDAKNPVIVRVVSVSVVSCGVASSLDFLADRVLSPNRILPADKTA